MTRRVVQTPKPRNWKGLALAAERTGLDRPARSNQLLSYGPVELGLRVDVKPSGGPEAFYLAHPELFRTGTTSRDEAYFYWALQILLGPEGAQGGWYYQSGHNDPNSAVVDFRITIGGGHPDLAVRIQSSYFHQAIGSDKQAFDEAQVYGLVDGGFDVIDVWSSYYINDPSGSAVLAVAQDAIAENIRLSPLVTGGL